VAGVWRVLRSAANREHCADATTAEAGGPSGRTL